MEGDNISLARRALTWLVYCKGDMTVSQLATAAAIDPDLEFDDESRLDEDSKILEICSCLIKKSPDKEIVSLAHLSVREFLTTQTLPDGGTNAYFISEPNGNLLISKACFSYLSSKYFELNPNHSTSLRPSEDRFFVYAVHQWREHVSKLSTDGRLLQSIIRFFKTGKDRTWLSEWQRQEKSERVGLYTNFYGGLHSLGLSSQIGVPVSCLAPPTPLYVAVTMRYPEVMTMLLDEGQDPNERGGYLDYPLFAAIENKDLKLVTMLLEADANPNITRGDQETPLHIAASFWLKDIVNVLIKFGAEVHAKTKTRKTPLTMALELSPAPGGFTLRREGHRVADIDFDLVECLLIGPDFYSAGETTPLHVAVEEIQYEAVKYILEKQRKAHLNLGDENGNTPLHLAARSSCAEMAAYLVNAGATKTVFNDQGWTPLHIAVWEKDLMMIETLDGASFNFTIPYGPGLGVYWSSCPLDMWRNNASASSLRFEKVNAQESIFESPDRKKRLPDKGLWHILSYFMGHYPFDHLYIAFMGACLFRLGAEVDGMDAHELSLSRNLRNVGAASVNDLFHGILCSTCFREIHGELFQCQICWRSYCGGCPNPSRKPDCRKHVLQTTLPREEWRKKHLRGEQDNGETGTLRKDNGTSISAVSYTVAAKDSEVQEDKVEDSDDSKDSKNTGEPEDNESLGEYKTLCPGQNESSG
jgi:ankyrin repeat protein